MQTFLPYADFRRSAAVLDRQRLGKQRVEAKQIWIALTNPSYGWQKHPAVLMWKGREDALALYGYLICDEWIMRGYKDTLRAWFSERLGSFSPPLPGWFGLASFHDSHKANLIRKDPGHYAHYWPAISPELPYVWPSAEEFRECAQ